jgi:hypothetical protein
MQTVVNAGTKLPGRIDPSAPENWGSGMADSARAMLEKLRAEERSIISRRDEALDAGDKALAGTYERQLVTKSVSGEPVPVRVSIANVEAQLARYNGRADVMKAARDRAIRDRR